MSNTFSLKIIASDKVFYSGKCSAIIVTAMDGEVEIMAHHEDVVLAVVEGEIRFRENDESEWIKVISGIGFTHVANNRVVVLVDTAERPEDIDAVRAQQAMERAQEQLRQEQSIQEYKVSRASLARAMVRLKEAGKIKIE